MNIKPPELELADVELSLTEHGFTRLGHSNALSYWQGTVEGVTRIVVVDAEDAPYLFRSQALRSIIRTSGIGARLFYWKAGKPLPWSLGPADPDPDN